MATNPYDTYTVENIREIIESTISSGYTPIIDIGSIFEDYSSFRIILTCVRTDGAAEDFYVQMNITRFFHQLYDEIMDLHLFKLNSYFIFNNYKNPKLLHAQNLVLNVLAGKFPFLKDQIKITNSKIED